MGLQFFQLGAEMEILTKNSSLNCFVESFWLVLDEPYQHIWKCRKLWIQLLDKGWLVYHICWKFLLKC